MADETERSRALALAYMNGERPYEELIAPDARLWMPGPPTHGRVMTREEYLALQAEFFARVEGGWTNRMGPIVAEGNRVSLQAESSVRLTNGKTYNNQYHLYFEVRDDQIVTYKSYLDTLHYAEVFSGTDPILGAAPRHTNLFDVPAD
jgi:ketosteroid isomerase-like protein